MTTSLPPTAAVPGHGASFIAVALGVAWCGVAISVDGTMLAWPTMLAAAASVALGLWLCHERRRLSRALHDQQTTHQAHAALLDVALTSEVTQVLERSAALLGATRAWLRIEPHLGGEDHHWSASAAASDDHGSDGDTPWWQDVFGTDDVFVSENVAPARCAVLLRQDDISLGVLAFEADHGHQAWGAREARLLGVLSALLRQLVLRRGLERALLETGEQGARERRIFLAHLSHKLRTPMTAVLGFAQILDLDQNLTAEHREFVREIEAAGKTLLEMLNELVGVPRE